MRTEDIKNLYSVTPNLHNRVSQALRCLDESAPVRYRKHRSVQRFAVVFAIVALLAAFSTVAYATHLFGLLTEHVGKYGVNMRVVEDATQSTSAERKNVKLKLGYVPEGYLPITDDNGFVNDTKYTYGGEPITDRWGFSFLIYFADEYDAKETYITKSEEKIVNGHKTVFMTQQFEDNSNPQYLAAEYFEDWNVVVVGYSDNQKELAKIMEHLELEEAADYTELPNKKVESDYEDNYGV